MTEGEKLQLKVVIVGAGLGGLGAAISVLLAGHDALILEGAKEISEIGAGIQILPNASKILLKKYGLDKTVTEYGSKPRLANLISWKGKELTSMNFEQAGKLYGSPFIDFHRADLHKGLLDRAVELGAKVKVNARVESIDFNDLQHNATVTTATGEKYTGDLIIGADGINSRLRELLLCKRLPPTPTGDLAYRLLIPAEKLLQDQELAGFVEDPNVNYWMGPDCHIVTYMIRSKQLLNMVLLCPDDIPEGSSTVRGDVEQMRSTFKDWDPTIGKLLNLCSEVDKWKLCIHVNTEKWSHPSGSLTLLGDSVHATLPYLASGAGMAIEDGSVLGECLSRIHHKSELPVALQVYEKCRMGRTRRIVERGTIQQDLYHLHDGPEQMKRDRDLQSSNPPGGEAFVWRDSDIAPWLLGYNAKAEVEYAWQVREN